MGHGIPEGFGLEGKFKIPQFCPTAMAGTPCTIPGWPWTLPWLWQPHPAVAPVLLVLGGTWGDAAAVSVCVYLVFVPVVVM